MADTTLVKIGGVVALAAGEVAWPRRSGVDPVTQSFAVTPDDENKLLLQTKAGAEVTLEVDERKIRKLRVLRSEPGPDPYLRTVLVADRRIDWARKWIVRRYNMPRKIGVRRRAEGWGEQLQVDVVPILTYAYYSLDNGQIWTPARIIADILAALGETEVSFDADAQALAVPVQALELHDNGADALRRALVTMPGADIDIDDEGRTRVFSTLSGVERKIVGVGEHDPAKPGSAGFEVIGGGHVVYVRDNYERPSEVHCLFAVESEIRVDFLEDRDDTNIYPANPPLAMRNVVRVPDSTLTLAEKDGGKTVSAGNYVEIGVYLRAINENSVIQVTDALLRQAMIPDLGLWEYLGLGGDLEPDAGQKNWGLRFMALRRDYRQLFQIERHWIDRILSLRNYLVATVDLTSGQRAPALVFSDYAYRTSQKHRYLQGALGGISYATNVSGYVDGDPGAEKQPTPAHVVIEDAEQGIVRLSWAIDPYNLRDYMFPSKLRITGKRDMRPHNRTVPVAFNAMAADGSIPSLETEAKIAMYFTAVPAAPNDTRQLYRIIVPAAKVAPLLPGAAREGLDRALGPPIEVFVPQETARIRWTEAKRDVIKRLFGIGGEPPTPAELDDLVVNDVPQQDLGASMASLQNLALATAAAIYARYHARVTGSMTGPMDTSARLEGSLREIRHHVRPDGAQLSTYLLAGQPDRIDLFSFLDSGTRQIVLRQVQGPLGGGGG